MDGGGGCGSVGRVWFGMVALGGVVMSAGVCVVVVVGVW